MRLEVLESGHRAPARLFVRAAELVLRQRMDDVILTGLHRPEIWGRPFFALLPEVMRGPSYWTAAEREQMAARVSRVNECPFCLSVHSVTIRIESSGDQAPPRAELAAVLTMLERLTTEPGSFGPADVDMARAAGVPDDAIADAMHVCFVFNTVNRLANAFGWTYDSEEHVEVAAKVIHRLGYRVPGFTLR